MSKQYTKVNVKEMTVEDGGILYDLEDLARLSNIYEKLCTAEFLLNQYGDEDSDNLTVEEAYKIACMVRDTVWEICECESEVIDTMYRQFLKEVRNA